MAQVGKFKECLSIVSQLLRDLPFCLQARRAGKHFETPRFAFISYARVFLCFSSYGLLIATHHSLHSGCIYGVCTLSACPCSRRNFRNVRLPIMPCVVCLPVFPILEGRESAAPVRFEHPGDTLTAVKLLARLGCFV